MKKNLSVILLVVLVFCFSGCKDKADLSSDVTSSAPKTESISSGIMDSSEKNSLTLENNDTSASKESVPSDNTVSVSQKSESSDNAVSDTETPPQNSAPAPTVKPREKMTGEWRFIIPVNKLPTNSFMYMGHRLVYDITIQENDEIVVSEKHFKRSDTDSGTVDYLDGERYILVQDSVDMIKGSFSGKLSISPENEKIAILDISGYEVATGRYLVEEKHYFELTDDNRLIWKKSELNSKDLKEQYFPWDAESAFTKK